MSDKKTMAHLLTDFDPKRPNDLLMDIFSKQAAFASKWCDFDNRKNYAQYRHWVDTFSWCIMDELSEVLGWLPWKHWKDYTDYRVEHIEVRFELIDILHFVVNLCLLSDTTAEDLRSYCKARGTDLRSLMLATKADFIYSTGEDLPVLTDNILYEYTKVYLGKINRIVSTFHNPAVLHAYRGRTDEKSDIHAFKTNVVKPGTTKMLLHLLVLFQLWNMNDYYVWLYYAAKNKENHARQERGYKEMEEVF